jgi:uncharacterized peroxidase-related enzyme
MEPRLRPLGPDEVGERARAIFDGFLRERGNVPNMFRTLARIPPLLETCFAHFRAVMAPGKVPAKVKELVAVRVSFANDCEYCLASHTRLARGLGATEAQVDALERGELAPFDAGERAALALADAMAGDARAVADEVVEAVRGAYGDDGLLEVVAVAGLFHYFNRLNNVLRMEVTR